MNEQYSGYEKLSDLPNIVEGSKDDEKKLSETPNKLSKNFNVDKEFLNYNAGPGIQHFALYTNDIVGSVRALKNREVEFYTVGNVYYEKLRCKLTNVNFEIVEDLQEVTS
uniref:4-hydroxyphenylpyruvate dioxygenase n=1 Tax=Romanomermis culicivorax TaxID=13658 RepID=A0A915JTX9_ROMCU